ncbi:MAG: EAL domain-containing protein [Pseudomonadota bacterium]
MKLLLVEDDENDVLFLQSSLKRVKSQTFDIVHCQTMDDAVSCLRNGAFELVMLDLNLPDSTGPQSVKRILDADPTVPVVVTSGQDDEDYAIEILNLGVQDYLVKWPAETKHIARAIRYAVERKRSELRLNYLAQYDTLTEIPNRQYFNDQLEKAIARAERTSSTFAVFYFDIDNFKTINDTMGHAAGDKLLRVVASRLRHAVRQGDTIARLGGDEFALVLEDVDSVLDVESFATHLLNKIKQPFKINTRAIDVTTSIGITLYPTDDMDRESLLRNADMAMYQAKDRGKNNFQFFTSKMHRDLIRFHSMETDIKQAISASQFHLVYQPQVSLTDHSVCGAEALIRWEHPERGAVSPVEFIPVAEEAGLAVSLGSWVLEAACQQLVQWRNSNEVLVPIAVNISPMQFQQPGFHHEVKAILENYQLPANLLELELTEYSLMQDTSAVQTCLHRLKDIGVRLAIDDFGTGHSCLSYLKTFPIDILKIDRSFVSDIGQEGHGTAVCSAIIAMAQGLNLQTVAEGIETQAQLEFMTRFGCDLGQGWVFGRAVSPQVLQSTIKKVRTGLYRMIDAPGRFGATEEVMS